MLQSCRPQAVRDQRSRRRLSHDCSLTGLEAADRIVEHPVADHKDGDTDIWVEDNDVRSYVRNPAISDHLPTWLARVLQTPLEQVDNLGDRFRSFG
jgi:hypothetical protein